MKITFQAPVPSKIGREVTSHLNLIKKHSVTNTNIQKNSVLA